MKYRILVTGANGQLGQCIQKCRQSENCTFFYTDINDLDITDIDQIREFVREKDINIIINAAAYTAVDLAETEETSAYRINRDAVANLATVAKEQDLFLIHISTDYVFDGNSERPYRPEDPVHPLSVYGKSKAAGEEAILASGCRAAIIRTSWLYSIYGSNFVKTILRISKERKEITVINDQYGTPTYAPDLAEALLCFLNKPEFMEGCNIYHYANEGKTSWHEFAAEIVRLSDSECDVLPVSSSEYRTVATRPQYSLFDLSKIKEKLSIEIPGWKDGLQRFFTEMIMQ